MKQKNLWILSGIPGAGKSTWAKKKVAENGGSYVSRDEVRFSLLDENEDYFAHEVEVFDNFIYQIQEALDKGGNVYADATHVNWGSRRKLIERLHLEGVNVGVVFFKTPWSICVERNSQRDGRAKVPNDVMRRMNHSITHPSNDPYKYAMLMNVYSDGGETIRYDNRIDI